MNSMYTRRRKQRIIDDLRVSMVKFWVKIGAITGLLLTLLNYLANGEW